MLAPLLALFIRSIRQDARAASTYWLRFALLLFVLLFLWTTQSTMFGGGGWMGAPGRQFFTFVTFLNFAALTLTGLGWFSSAIAEEKEESTLGLLRMTNLNAFSILLGKSTSRFVGALLLLTAQVPFTFLAVTMGGVSLAQILAVYATLAAYTWLLCNLALFASVLCPRVWSAMLLTVFLLFLWGVGAGLTNVWVETQKRAGDPAERASAVAFEQEWLPLINDSIPPMRLTQIMVTGAKRDIIEWPVLAWLGAGAFWLLLAWALFERFSGRAQTAEETSVRGMRWYRRFRPGRAWARTLEWKDFHYVAGGWPVMVLKTLGYTGGAAWIWAAMFATWNLSKNNWAQLGQSIEGWGQFLLHVEVCILAAMIFFTERKQQTLTTLGALPQTITSVAFAKARGCALALGPVLAFCALGLAIHWANYEPPAPPPGVTEPNVTFGYGTAVYSLIQYAGTLVGLVFITHLTACLSLRLKWAALPAALGIWLFLTIALSMLSLPLLFMRAWANNTGMMWMYVQAAFNVVVLLGISVGLHFDIRRRLERLIGEA